MKMKIAVFHQFLDNIGGAEIVTLTLARELNADVYTTNIDKEKIIKMGFSDVLLRIKSIGKIPINAPFRQQSSLSKFKKLNLKKKYDFYIIAGDWAMSSAINNKPNLWYIHSPLNELWAFKGFIKKNLLSWWKKPIFEIWVMLNKILTRKYSKHINNWVCNSNNTKNRIKKYYYKDATIINPPIETKKYKFNKFGDYWLSVNRLAVAKRIEIQMKAFAKMPDKKLIIVGSYEKGAKQFEDYKKYLQKIKTKNIEIINWIDDKKLAELYANCKGFITSAIDEDFGMTVLEAMASGKPVIAPDEGGYKETITKNTGVLIDNINEDKLIEAVKVIENKIKKNPGKIRKECEKQAKKFDTKVFIEKIKRIIAYKKCSKK